MQCPSCGLFNPDTAVRCDCGYEFQARRSRDVIEAAETARCQNCGSSSLESGYGFPLCATCRDILSARPLPGWARVALGATAIVVLVALNSLPSSLKAGIAYRRGQSAEAAARWDEAARQYSIVAQRFPNSILASARSGIAHFRNGNYREAARVFNALAGRKADAALADEVNAAISEMEKMLK